MECGESRTFHACLLFCMLSSIPRREQHLLSCFTCRLPAWAIDRYRCTINMLAACPQYQPYGEQWKKMRRVLTSEILSPALEHRLQSRRTKEADHIDVSFVYNQCTTTTSVDVRHVAQHFCGNLIRSLMFSKRNFFEPSPGSDEVEHVSALFTLVNCVFGFRMSDYFPSLIGLDLDGHQTSGRILLNSDQSDI